MKTLYKALVFFIGLTMLFTGCKPEELVFEHEKPQFDTKGNAILLEVIVPAGTSAKDQIYIVGEFNGMDTLLYENPDFILTKAENNDAKFGIYLYPEDFVAGKSLADGFLFVSKQFGIEAPAVAHTIENAQLGERYTISVTRWGGAAVTPAIEHDGYVMYIDNQTGWDELAVYAWGDAEIFGGWPGAPVTGIEVIDGITYRYVDFGQSNEGLSVSLIFNNNGAGTQLNDYAFVVNRNVYLRVTPDGVEEIAEPGDESFPDVEHDGDVVYLIDAAEWGTMALYMWGDVNDLNGGWPGMTPTGQFDFGGYKWYYFDLGAANAGKEEHLIANNNGGGTQIDDIAVYQLTTDSVLFFIVNADRTVTQAFSPDGVLEALAGGPVEVDPAEIDVFLLDATELLITDTVRTDTTYTLAVYAWGSSELFGGWPGMQVSEMEDVDVLGLGLKHYHIDCKTGDNYNLIFNNSGNGRQLPDYAVSATEPKQAYYLKVTDDGVVPLQVQPLAPSR
ncbi:MAG: hypothetical protein J6T76_04105 [Paludibacteraceae bacterium]|nr:hypothetical protein [Paludibacteraceae bacterium]